MAKLTLPIPPANYELIRDRIAVILADELANQHALSGALPAATVWIERGTAFDKSELPAVNVALFKGDFDNKDARQVDGSYTFMIDCYASAKSMGGTGGDYRATVKLHRIVAMVRAILENPAYRTLDFAPPSISRVAVNAIDIGMPQDVGDATNTVRGRLEFLVRVPERVELKTALTLVNADTSVKLGTTELGYQYQVARGDVVIGDDGVLVIGDDGIVITPDGQVVVGDDNQQVTGDDNTVIN